MDKVNTFRSSTEITSASIKTILLNKHPRDHSGIQPFFHYIHQVPTDTNTATLGQPDRYMLQRRYVSNKTREQYRSTESRSFKQVEMLCNVTYWQDGWE